MGLGNYSRQIRLLLVALWAVVLLYLSLTPSPPQVEGPLGWDKVQHAAALGVLAFLVFGACRSFGGSPFLSAGIGFVCATLFGGLIELLQAGLTTYRQADPMDLAADAVGAFIAVLLPYFFPYLRGAHVKLLMLPLLMLSLLMPLPAFGEENADVTVIGELSGGVKRLAGESVDLVTTPFRIENGNILLTLGVVGVTSLTYAFDRDIQDKLLSHRSHGKDKAADIGSIVGNPLVHLGFSAFIYGMAIVEDDRKWKEIGEMMAEALVLADASSLIMKQAVGRGRPYATGSKNDFKPFGFKKDYDSFPSMHTASSFALASVLASTSESFAMKSGYYLAATFVGLSRAYKNRHWASDVVFGAALGEVCGRVVTNYHASEDRVALVPQAYENGAGLALVGTW